MEQTFEHLLGLPTPTAMALLSARGITDVQVVLTAAPPRRTPAPEDALRSSQGEAQGYASTRVVAVHEDGHRLVVARFLVDSPALRGQGGESKPKGTADD